MVAPLLAPIVAMLADKGLDLVSKAVESGADKAIDFVSEKTGVDLHKKKSLAPEEVVKLKNLELNNEKDLRNFHLENTKSAREMNVKIQETANASWIAKNTSYLLDFMVVGATILLGFALFVFEIPTSNKEISYMLFGQLVGLCITTFNFHRGSSHGSKESREAIHKAMAK